MFESFKGLYIFKVNCNSVLNDVKTKDWGHAWYSSYLVR